MDRSGEKDVSICIVNYRTRDALNRLLASIPCRDPKISLEIWVVDNNSSDGSIEMVSRDFPEVNLIENPHNLGFAKAANQAMRASSGRYYLLSNPDVVVHENVMETMLDVMEKDPGIGILGCRLTDPQGRTLGSCGSFPKTSTLLFRSVALDKILKQNTRLREKYELDYCLFPEKRCRVDCVIGAFIMVRRSAVQEVGMLDEQFFLYGEDLDWCWRMREQGWKTSYIPDIHVTHEQGVSASLRPLRSIVHFHLAMLKFYRKHQKEQIPLLFRGLVPVGVSLKLVLSLIRHGLGIRSGARVYRTTVQ